MYFSIINYSQKIFYIKSAVLNMYKYFKDFKHFLPRERTLQATVHHHLWPFMADVWNSQLTNMTEYHFFCMSKWPPNLSTVLPPPPRYPYIFSSRPNFRATTEVVKRLNRVLAVYCTIAVMSCVADMSSDVTWNTQPIISCILSNNTQLKTGN